MVDEDAIRCSRSYILRECGCVDPAQGGARA